MALADWHHNFRLTAFRVVATEVTPEQEVVQVAKREEPDDDTGDEVCVLTADEALALGDMLRLWAQGAMARKEQSRG